MQYISTFFLCIFFSLSVLAESTISFHKDEVKDGYNFILATPKSSDRTTIDDTDTVTKKMPLIISLHSRSASGKNLQDVDNFGTIDAIESGMDLNAYVLAPQATGEKWDVEKIMNDVEYVIANKNIDTNRIYAIGMSMGGNGVAELVNTYPDRIAAAIILAGGIDGNVAEMSKVPLWVIRGLNDREEAIRRTDKMVENIRKTDSSRIVYTKVKGVDHRQHERILYMPYYYYWLMSHNLQNLNRPVNTTMDVTLKDLKDSYKGLKLRDGSAAKRKSRAQGHGGPRGPRRH